MMNVKRTLVVLLIFLFILTGCATTDTVDKYISFSITRAGRDGSSLISEVYYAGLNDKDATLVGEVESKAQNTSIIYDKKRDTIYYSDKDKDRHADEVYAFDCKTNENIQLTDDFYAIHRLFLKDDELVIAAIPKGELAIILFSLDLDSYELTARSIDRDFEIRAVYLDPNEDSLLISGYSASERRNRIEHQDTIEYKPCASTFYLVDKDYNWKELWVSPEVDINTWIYQDGNDVYFQMKETYEYRSPSHIYI